MKIYFSIVILLSILISCQEQEEEEFYYDTISYGYNYSQLRPELLDSFLILEDLDWIPPYYNGWGKYPQIFKTYRWFIANINAEEARSLYYHRSNFIKAIAIEGMYWNRDPIFGKLFIESFKNDSMFVEIQSGCLVNYLEPKDVFINCFANPNSFYLDSTTICQSEKIALDSLIMNSSDSSYYREYRPKEFYSERN